MRVIRNPVVSTILVSKGLCLWLICFEDLQLFVLLITEQTLDYLFIFVVTEPN
jgi:hypothetical protein